MHMSVRFLFALIGSVLVAGAALAEQKLQGAAPDGRVSEAKAGKIQVTLNGLSSTAYFIDLPSNVSEIRATTVGSAGDIDIFVRPGTPHAANTFEGLIAESSGSSTGNTSNEEVRLVRADGLTPGRWWVTLVNFSEQTATFEFDISVATSGQPFSANLGQSGTWYEPAKNLQGLFIQYITSAQAIVVWFTFTPEGEQAWLLGVGDVVGDRIEITDLSRTRGGRFGEAFDPNEVIYEDIGDLLITFDSCTTGYASFLPQQAGWPVEQLRLEQLTGVAGLNCANTKAANYVGPGMSGSWFDPSRSGEGWLVQVLNEDLVVAYWFTYDSQGRQVWVGGVGELVNGSFIVNEVIQPVGGRFGPNYSPDQVSLNPWGAMAMTFTGCGSAAIQAFGPQEFGPYGSGSWKRLTPLAGTPSCDLQAAPAQLAANIQAAPFASQDGDVNDPATPNTDNDTPAQTQAIGNPQAVAGFVAATPTGRSGDRFEAAADTADAYRATLTAGQTLQLLISDWNSSAPTSIDFDLYLYRAGDASAPVQTALGTDRNEFITVAETGQYDIVVVAFSGSGNYTLAISSAPAPANAASLKLEDDAMPDEIIVRFDERFDDGTGPVGLYKSVAQRQQELGLPLLRGQPGRSQLYSLPKAKGTRDLALAGLQVNSEAVTRIRALGWGMSAQQAEAMDRVVTMKALRARPDVRFAEPNYRFSSLAIPADRGYSLQWNLPIINMPQAWDVSLGLPNTWVSVLDTGVNPHPDLAANVLYAEGADLVTDVIAARDGNSRDRDARDPGDGALPEQDSFHGTHVAGVIAALQNTFGISGVAPRVRVMPVRVLGAGGGTSQDIADGMLWSAGLPVSGASASRAADVLNLSLGGVGSCPAAYLEAVSAARSQGAIVVAAAGNDNSSASIRPADCSGVVKVSALGPDYLPANYSNCANVDVAAPGGELADDSRAEAIFSGSSLQLCKGSLGGRSRGELDGILSLRSSRTNPVAEGYAGENGTSQAAPHVAGVAALMKSVYPGLTPDEFDSLLANGRLTFDPRSVGVAVPASISNEYSKHYGAGIIDAFAAVSVARERANGAAAAAAIIAQPTSIDFGEIATSLPLTTSRVGSGAASVTGITEDAPWLTVTGGGPNGVGQYTLTVSRSGLPEAEYSTRLRIATSSSGTIEIPVSMRVGARPTLGKAGTVYALVIDGITLQSFGQQVAELASGSGRVAFNGIYPGAYYVLYGTDNDNDLVICDPGEFCGFLPFGDSREPLFVNGQNVDIGFAPLFPDLSGIGSANAASKAAGTIDEASRRLQ